MGRILEWGMLVCSYTFPDFLILRDFEKVMFFDADMIGIGRYIDFAHEIFYVICLTNDNRQYLHPPLHPPIFNNVFLPKRPIGPLYIFFCW